MPAGMRQSDVRNSLLHGLSEGEFALFAPLLVAVDLPMRQCLETARRPIRQVYFPDDGLISVVAVSRPSGKPAEVGLIGRDGMTGIALVHGIDRSPFDTIVQVPGKAWTIEAAALSALMKANRSMLWRFLRYAHLFYLQVGGAVLANATGSTEERLSRWLLMMHDRLGVDRLHITHELFSVMLGVRRPGVTISLRRLEAEGLVEVRRGVVAIRDRAGL